ncbi:hypothetical protein Tco_1535182, partial [Tanacetum coccineum]
EPRTLGEEHDENKSKQSLAFLFQAIPEDMVLQMASYTDPKQVWDGLKIIFLGVDRVRTARLATLKIELESLRMKEGESVNDFASKLTVGFDEAVGRLKAYEERIKGAEKIEDTQGGLLLASDGKLHGCKRCANGDSNQDGFGRDQGRGRSNECPKWEKHEANLIEEEPTLL